MIGLINSINRRFPVVRKAFWGIIYDFFAWHFPYDDWIFMNYGYIDEETQNLKLAPEDEPTRYFIQLYARMLRYIEVKDRDLLEVGCGRGGGSSWIARTQNVRSMTGIDLSKRAIALCQKLHQHKSLKYLQGDAESLPFLDGSFDIVLNIESCHHYPSMSKFLEEVTRVLRPDGYLWVTDYREIQEFDELKQALYNSDLEVVRFADVTPGIIKAFEIGHSVKMDLLQRHCYLPFANNIAEARIEEIHRQFVQGELIFIEALLQKK
ncbi:MAG: class I SAM-dependent methyltransferase [Spirulina sp.]